MAVELQPLVLESTLTMQKILEAKDHTARLKLVRHFVEAESKRLNTKKALKGMFAGTATTSFDSSMPEEERKLDDDTKDKDNTDDVVAKAKKSDSTDESKSSSSIFMDEPDAFQ